MSDVEGLDLDALEKAARIVPTWADTTWELDRDASTDAFEVRVALDGDVDGDTGRHLITGGDLVALMPDVLGDGDLAKFIATFDPPTVLRLLAALRAQAERVRVLEGERDEARNAVVKCKDVALAIADCVDDEGDRAYFGSTNDPDTLKALARELDALHWHHVRPAPHPAEARAEAAERRAGELEGVWAWFAARTNLELSHHYPEELDDGAWVIHRVSGGRNDREWEEISTGETPLAAVLAARALLTAAQAENPQEHDDE